MLLLSPDQYQTRTAILFEEIAKRLSVALPFARIEHVGASAIPGAISKGDLDLCVLVPADKFSESLREIEQLGYLIKSDTLRTSQLCMLIPTEQDDDHAIQLVEAGSEFEFFVTFRDALRRAPELVQQYNQVKRDFADKDVQEYRKAKGIFISGVLAANQLSKPAQH